MDKINFNLLDSIRGIASFYVCFNHARGHFFQGINNLINYHPMSDWALWEKIYYSFLQLTILGHEFVIVFFVLSGFSIAYSVSNIKNKYFDFYKRRIVRLYPPYLIGVVWAYLIYTLIACFVPEWLDSDSKIHVATLLSQVDMFHPIIIVKNLFYLNTGVILAQYWSLIFEIIFYALIPIFILKRKIYYAVSLILFIVFLYIKKFNYSDNDSIIFNYFFHYNFYFFIGVWVFHNRNLIFKKYFSNKIIDTIFLFFLFFLMVGARVYLSNYNVLPELISMVFSVLLMRLFLVYELKIKILEYLGAQSYTLYVSHFATIFLIKLTAAKVLGYQGENIQNPFVWLIIPFICVFFAQFLYKIGEEPSKKLLSKLRAKSK